MSCGFARFNAIVFDNEEETLIDKGVSLDVEGGIPVTPLRKEKVKLKLCLVGDNSVGKTSLVRRFVFDDFDDKYLATLGAKVTKRMTNVKFPELGVEFDVAMIIHDIMGSMEFRTLLREAYFYGAQGLIAVCDLTSEVSLNSLEDWIDTAYSVTGRIPVELLGNKVDLKDEHVVPESDIEELGRSYKAPYKLTSAKTGVNVEHAFEEIAKMVVEQRLKAKLLTT